MELKLLFCLVYCVGILNVAVAHPQPVEDSSESLEDDTQQQQQQIADAESLEEFTKNLQMKTKKLKPDDPCLDPLVVGPCRARVPKFFFNSVEGKCEKFYYGGCQGSKNNFDMLTECESDCSSHIKKLSQASSPDMESLTEICEMPPVKGPKGCTALMPRWTFNATEGKCIQFIYGGCGATKNNYPNQFLCQSMCSLYHTTRSPKGENPGQENSAGPLGGICNLPMNPGLCYALQQKYYFNKDKNRCERFQYGGCGGNENRFSTAEECMRTCGGDTPSSDVECSKVECPWSLYTHYTTLGCKPIYDGQACCPTRFDCPEHNNNIESRSLTISNDEPHCMYKGISYPMGESVDEASDTASCRAGCICTGFEPGNPKITCASIECPENLGAIPPGKEDCLPLYKRGSCCAYDFFCPNQTATDEPTADQENVHTENFKCVVDDKEYYEGQRFYPKSSSCQKCICQEGFNGTLSQSFCEPIDCGIEIYYSHYLEKGCSPVYFHSDEGDSCCPISWECPGDKRDHIPLHPLSSTTPLPEPGVTLLPKDKLNRRVSADACTLPLAIGDCKGNRPRYFYNNESQKCEKFSYTGCNGNTNNFVALQDCEQLCESSSSRSPHLRSGLEPIGSNNDKTILLSEMDPCTMPTKQGNCRAYFPRYFFSPEDNTCKFFIYGGCRGNHNNFYSSESCEATCTNKIPIENLRTSIPASAAGADGDDSKVIFGDDSSLIIEHFKPTEDEVESIEQDKTCNLPPAVGLCRAFVRRFYYDPEVKYCKRFIYGGCGGNANNFLGLRACDLRCSPNKGKGLPQNQKTRFGGSKSPEEILSTPAPDQIYPGTINQPPSFGFTERCRLPMKAGSCYAQIPTFYYNVSTKSCQPFVYGGCFGNANRFNTLMECEAACKRPVATDESTEPGGVPMTRGASLNHTRYQVDDPNVISTSQRPPVNPRRPEGGIISIDNYNERVFCGLLPEKGLCNAHILRYYWDQGAAKCLPYVYSGCKGNKNNFLTESDCLSVCGNEPTIEQLTSEGILSCTFGNETLPLGASIDGQKYTTNEPPCGVPVCQCLTPPSVTCIQTMCPTPPPQPETTTETTSTPEKICPTPSCGPHCIPTTGLDGCPTCDCDSSESLTPIHTQVQVQEVLIKSVKG